MTKYFDSGLYNKYSFYIQHKIDFDSDKKAYEGIEYNSELFGKSYKKDICLECSNEDEQREKVNKMFWDVLSYCPTYFEPFIFDEKIALECFLTPFTFKGKGMLALSEYYGTDVFPRLDAYQALVHNSIDRKSGFLVTGADDYFESAVGKEVSKKVLQVIKRYSEEDEESMEARDYANACAWDGFYTVEFEEQIACEKVEEEKTEEQKSKDRINVELAQAVQDGELDRVKSAIAAGANVNYGAVSTVLMRAVNAGYIDIVKVLIKAGVDINYRDTANKTALIRVAYRGYADIVKVLIKAGADTSIKDDFNRTALICAAYSGYTNIVKILIKAGVDLNAKDVYNKTALIHASCSGYTDIVKVLINAGADSSIKDESNRTALMWAIINNKYYDIACLLESEGSCLFKILYKLKSLFKNFCK